MNPLLINDLSIAFNDAVIMDCPNMPDPLYCNLKRVFDTLMNSIKKKEFESQELSKKIYIDINCFNNNTQQCLNNIRKDMKLNGNILGNSYSEKTLENTQYFLNNFITFVILRILLTQIQYKSIPLPAILPGEDDEIDIEWVTETFRLSISITGKDELSGVYGLNRKNRKEFLKDFNSNSYDILQELIDFFLECL